MGNQMTTVIMPEEAIIMMMHVAEGYEGLKGLGAGGLYFPYKASGDKAGLLTIGKGHLCTDHDFEHGINLGGTIVKPQSGITYAQVGKLFTQDVRGRADGTMKDIGKATPQQAAAWLDMRFNCPSAFSIKSTPLKMHKAGLTKMCAKGFLQYVSVRHGKIKGVEHNEKLRGLWRRRCTVSYLYYTGKIHIAKTDATEKQLEDLMRAVDILIPKPKFGCTGCGMRPHKN